MPRAGPSPRESRATRSPDAAEADDAERLAVDIGAEHHQRIPALVLAGPHHAVALDDPARRRKKKGEGEIRAGLGQHAGRMSDEHAAARRLRDVDMVQAD